MSIKNISTLKTYFETGDTPTQSQFADLIDTLNANVIRFPKHSSVTVADIGKLIMNDQGIAKVVQKEIRPEQIGEIKFEVTVAPEIPIGSVWTVQLAANPSAGDTIRIFNRIFVFVVGATVRPFDIQIGLTLSNTLLNISATMDAYGQGGNSFGFFSVTDDGVDTLTIDFSSPNSSPISYPLNSNSFFTIPPVQIYSTFDFVLSVPYIATPVVNGSNKNWVFTNEKFGTFVKLFGIPILLSEILSEMTTNPADATRAVGYWWANNATIFSDAIEQVLISKSTYFTYSRDGNEFTVHNNHNTDSPNVDFVKWEFESFGLVGESTTSTNVTNPVPDTVSGFFSRGFLGVLVGVDGSSAIIDKSLIFKATIGGSENVVSLSDFDWSAIVSTNEIRYPMYNVCVPTDDGKIETFLSAINPFVTSVFSSSPDMISKFASLSAFLPLESGAIGDEILVLNVGTTFPFISDII